MQSEPQKGIICGKCRCQIEAFHEFYLRIESIHNLQVFVPEPVFVDTIDRPKIDFEIIDQIKIDESFSSEADDSIYSSLSVENEKPSIKENLKNIKKQKNTKTKVKQPSQVLISRNSPQV